MRWRRVEEQPGGREFFKNGEIEDADIDGVGA